jgi:hypothetical protein
MVNPKWNIRNPKSKDIDLGGMLNPKWNIRNPKSKVKCYIASTN